MDAQCVDYARKVTKPVVFNYTRDERKRFHDALRTRPMFVRRLVYDSIIYWRRIQVDMYRGLKRAAGRARHAADIARKVGERVHSKHQSAVHSARWKRIFGGEEPMTGDDLRNVAIAVNFLLISSGVPTLQY